MAKVLLTGMAGFIGFHLARRLIAQGHDILGIDSINDYYDPSLKLARLNELGITPGFLSGPVGIQSAKSQSLHFRQLDLANQEATRSLFGGGTFDWVIHLAAQPGARTSLTHPYAYIDSNILGFVNILEGCRHSGTGHFIYASSSSVYDRSATCARRKAS